MLFIRAQRKPVNVSGNFKNMRRLTIYIAFLTIILPTLTFGQNKTVDLLIQDLSNNELRGECNYVWVLKSKPGIVDLLIPIGKPATQQLLDVLTSKDKGIVAHYILSKIWFKSIYTMASFENFDKDRTVKYKIGNLTFYENEAGLKFTNPGDLEKIKDEWKAIIDNKSSH